MKKSVILFLSFLFLFHILSIRLIDIKLRRVCPIVPTSIEVSQNEADIFLQNFQEYVARGYDKKIPEDFSYDATDVTARLPWIVKKWFEKECIHPERFYYIEQRLRTGLKAYELKKHADHVASVLSQKITKKMDAEQKKWYNDMIENQKKMSKIEGISDQEFDYIASKEEKIRAILR